MGGVFSMLMEGISVLKGKEPKRLKCWEGYEYKRREDRRARRRRALGRGDILLVRKIKGSVASSELRVWGKASALWFFWRGEWQPLSFGTHHRHARIIFGGDFEVSMLNFLYLQFIFLIIFSSLWYEDCIAWVWIIKATHDCCYLLPWSLRNFLTELGIFYQPAEPVQPVQHHSWQPLSAMRNTCLSLSGSHSSELGIENCFFCFLP